MKTFSGVRSRQQLDELSAFISILQAEHVGSYLEIGACHGDTFHAVMSALPVGARGVAVDLPEAAWGKRSSRPALEAAVIDLRAKGYDASAIFGDSAATEVKQLIMVRGPYDAALIDADHRYEAVKADWLAYGPQARLVAFHDIDGDGVTSRYGRVEVPRLWREIKGTFKHREIVGAVRGMGIGVIWQ
jgi:hypothetical protein